MAIKMYGAHMNDIVLRHRQDRDGTLLEAVDKNGGRLVGGSLLRMSQSDGIYLFGNVAPSLGFPLDSTGHIKICNI